MADDDIRPLNVGFSTVEDLRKALERGEFSRPAVAAPLLACDVSKDAGGGRTVLIIGTPLGKQGDRYVEVCETIQSSGLPGRMFSVENGTEFRMERVEDADQVEGLAEANGLEVRRREHGPIPPKPKPKPKYKGKKAKGAKLLHDVKVELPATPGLCRDFAVFVEEVEDTIPIHDKYKRTDGVTFRTVNQKDAEEILKLASGWGFNAHRRARKY